MITDALIEGIVSTYALPPKVEQRIIGIAKIRISELGLFGFDSAYSYVANLVEKFRTPYKEHVAARLDRPAKEGSKNELVEILKVDDDSSMITENEGQGIPLNEAFALLKGRLSQSSLRMLKLLMQNANGSPITIDLTVEEILKAVPAIDRDLSTLSAHGYQNIAKLFGSQPIASVQLYPALLIKYEDGSRSDVGQDKLPTEFLTELGAYEKKVAELYAKQAEIEELSKKKNSKRKSSEKDPTEVQDDRPKVYLTDAIGVLNGRLIDVHLDIFRQLARFSGGDPVVLNTLDDVSASADRTVMGLDIIADRYRRGDAVILPPRPVHHIVFNPIFNVVYGYRTYGNGPMDFFLRNIDHYRGIQSKSEFKSFDPGLYSALHGRGQFEAALNCLSISSAPVRKHVYSPRKTSPSINRFDRFKASRWYHSVHRRSSPRKKLSHEDAVAAHHSFEGNANFAARRMEIGRQTLVRHWKEHGLKTKGTHWQFRQQTKNKLKCQP